MENEVKNNAFGWQKYDCNLLTGGRTSGESRMEKDLGVLVDDRLIKLLPTNQTEYWHALKRGLTPEIKQ